MDFVNPKVKSSGIVIIDFGSQYTQLITRRVRESGIFSEIVPHNASIERILENKPKGIILSGGPNSVFEKDAPNLNLAILEIGIPILGICYGMQLLAQAHGGEVKSSSRGEYGFAEVTVSKDSQLFEGVDVDRTLKVWMSHGDSIIRLGEGFVNTGSSINTPCASFESDSAAIYGLQFHPEVTHTEEGKQIISNFLFSICQCEKNWMIGDLVTELIDEVRRQVGSEKVLLGLSGGVDSSVVAALVHKAIGKQLTCVFVDNGLLRLNEAGQVIKTFRESMGLDLVFVDAADEFLDNLRGIVDPEEKRKVIGKTFIEVFDREAEKLTGIKWLAQGTIYPDVIESAGSSKGGSAHVIKSHHNVGGLPDHMKLKLLEPLRAFFKDEVRSLGRGLGLSDTIVDRHPFPGPGLGVRILNEVTKESADILREADHIFIQELVSEGLYQKVSQAFAVFLPIKSVGVMGDGRAYSNVIALRAVETSDFMTANWARLPYDFLGKVSLRIINEVQGVSRVVYDISGKPPATIEWE